LQQREKKKRRRKKGRQPVQNPIMTEAASSYYFTAAAQARTATAASTKDGVFRHCTAACLGPFVMKAWPFCLGICALVEHVNVELILLKWTRLGAHVQCTAPARRWCELLGVGNINMIPLLHTPRHPFAIAVFGSSALSLARPDFLGCNGDKGTARRRGAASESDGRSCLGAVSEIAMTMNFFAGKLHRAIPFDAKSVVCRRFVANGTERIRP
jgi:hypothetical protein